jgi:hypothetical protein
MKSADYISFLKKLSILILGIIIFDKALGFVIMNMYFNETQGESSVTTCALESTQANAIVFGSSRASHHYDTELLSKLTGMSFYNCGKDGIGIKYCDIVLQEVLKRYTPKMIILDLNVNELNWKSGKEGDDIIMSSLMPYISKHEGIFLSLNEINKWEVLKSRISLLYRFNSMPFSILQHHLKIGNKSINGYLPLIGTTLIKKNPVFLNDSIQKSDSVQRKHFINFIQLCNQKRIVLKAFISPIFGSAKVGSTRNEMIQILNNQKIHFNDFSRDSDFLDYTLFKDQNHLNIQGVRKYNKKISSLLTEK